MDKMLFTEIPAAHMRLFRREFVDATTTKDFNTLRKYINCVQNRAIIQLVHEHKFLPAKHFLFWCLAYSEEIGAMEEMQRIIERQASEEVRKQLYLRELNTHMYYSRFFIGDNSPMKMERLMSVLEPEPIVNYLRKVNTREYEPLIERVDKLIQERLIDEATCELLRGLPYCSDQVGSTRQLGDWYYDFLDACLTSGYTTMIPRYISASYEEDVFNRKAKKEIERKKHLELLPSISSCDLVVESDFVVLKEPRNQKNYAKYRNTTLQETAFGLQRRLYTLYPYQNELVSAAHSGKNTIVCAPTGSGKTIVATDIVMHHVQELRRQDRVARVVMLVPTVPLVEQQTLHFIQYTYGICWVDGISGAESVDSRAGNVLAADLCVMTPQILINMLNSVLKSERVYFSDFTMLIFDECHHVASGAHPYKVLMEMLEKANMQKSPQIIGLTASIGTGSSLWDIRSCRRHMLNLCAYMRVNTISTVRKNLDDLRAHVIPPVDMVERVSRPVNDEFSLRIRDAMMLIQELMLPLLENLLASKTSMLKRDNTSFPPHDNASRYQTVVAGLKRDIQRLENNNELRMFLLRCIDHLSHYFHTLSISDLLPNKYGLQYLEAKMSSYKNFTEIDKNLLSIYKDMHDDLRRLATVECLEEKGILKSLYAILVDQYTRKPESRTLIFVSTRSCALHISHHLSEYLSTLENVPVFYGKTNCVGYMTSSNQSAAIGGQSAEVQRQMRARFERGNLKILAVTSVADEGINIMECNLVIKYNSVGSERTMIQRRGRARAKDSRSILLALDNGIEIHEYENVRKEMMMYKCIEDLQSLSEEGLKMQILAQGEMIRQERERRKHHIEQRRERLHLRKYLLKCRTCNEKICESMEVRKLSEALYVVCDAEVWSRSTQEVIKKPSKDGLITTCARWTCFCNQEWGSIVRYAGAFLPRLDAKAFVLERLDTQEAVENRSNNKWSLIEDDYFNIEPISPANINEMLQAMIRQVGRERQEKLEQQEELAKQLLIDKHMKRPERKVKARYLDE